MYTDDLQGTQARLSGSATFVSLAFDFAEIESNSTTPGGAGTAVRELYVTFFHELGHLVHGIGATVSETGVNFTEGDLDDFATNMLNSLELAATNNNDNPYEAEECPLND